MEHVHKHAATTSNIEPPKAPPKSQSKRRYKKSKAAVKKKLTIEQGKFEMSFD